MGDEDSGQPDLSSLRQKAQRGDAKAEYLLGSFYMTGVSQDYKEAARWYHEAAAQDLADAEFGLGYLYEQGKGVERDYRQAVAYYTAAAKQGHVTAANNLGSMYERGEGLGKNPGEAAHWYRAAANHGDAVQFGVLILSRKRRYTRL
jgi:TPR repeat protein